MITTLLIWHLLVGIVAIVANDKLGRRAFALAALAPAAVLAWLATRIPTLLDGDPITEEITWVGELNLGLDLRLDAFGLVMVLLVSGIGLGVCIYALGYFSGHAKPDVGRLAGLMTLFAGAMFGVVTADHLIGLFVFWELTSITSYLLIGNDDTDSRARGAALQAILITGAGGLAMLAGLIILGQEAGTYRLSELVAQAGELSGGTVTAGLLCVLVGAFTKSAQFPFSLWLPGAMVAPTPISAYLHSATMVKAGVYLVARLAPLFAVIGPWRSVVLAVGAVTMFTGGWRALRQYDLKLLLAYGTISQLGFMMMLLGTGVYSVGQAGVALLLAHGAFKAALFMVVGIIDHQTHTRDVRHLHGFGRGWGLTVAVAVVGAASMAGLPPLLGFISKEKALDALEHAGFAGAGWALGAVVAGSILTFAYSARFVLGVLGRLGDPDRTRISTEAHPPSAIFVAPSIVLTVFTVAAGLAPVLVNDVVREATMALYPGSDPATVVLWAGVNTALVLSVVIVAAGVGLVAGRRVLAQIQDRIGSLIEPIPPGEKVFSWCVQATIEGCKRLTGVIQNGSLPIYLAVILGTAAILPMIPILTTLNGWPDLIDTPVHIPLAILVVGATFGATLIRRRIAAALLLGGVGYAMAGFYIAQGAPDLALTQFAVETLITVLFVLVLSYLPKEFVDRAPAVVRPARIGISVLVAGVIFAFAIVASQGRGAIAGPAMSEEMIERSAPDAHGNNVVNVILVDFRGLDTLGEITVVMVAAVGAVALARIARRPNRQVTPTEEPTEEPV